jgi:RNA polymerase sigma-70 factor (ECF subfamily)
MTQNVVSLSAVPRSRGMREGVRWQPPKARASQNLAQVCSDEELLRSIARGERSAMETLFARHNVRVFRFGLSITRNRSLAETIVSDVFFDVWRRPGTFQEKSQVSTWLLAIAHHKAFSLLRRPADEELTDELCADVEDLADNPEATIAKKQMGTILAKCILKLSAIHREIVDLVYYHEKSIEEVTQILQVPIGTVKTRMFHARQHLARLLASEGNTEVSLLL